MIKYFFVGIIQGAFLAMLLSTFNLSFFGWFGFILGFAMQGAGTLTNIVLWAGVNVLFYLFVSRRVMKLNPVIFIFGVVIGIILS
ncbi:MAG: hypothetical protein WCW44_02755 [archaeon]|jgi:hypothetical protein